MTLGWNEVRSVFDRKPLIFENLNADSDIFLPFKQKDDLKAVVAHLRKDKRVSCIGLWGRSMGAVTW